MKLHLEFEQRVEIAHALKYISPSSLKTYLNCPHKFYLSKLSEHKDEIKKLRAPQSKAAAFGSAFDSLIKAFLSREYGEKTYSEDELLTREVPVKKIRDKVVPHARQAFELYMETAYPYIEDEGIVSIDCEPDVSVGLAKVFGKLDLQQTHTVLDWKCRGYLASSKSPHPGWVRRWKYSKKEKGFVLSDQPHKRYEDPFEEINAMWALQVTIYALMNGHEVGKELMIAIDEISMRNVQLYSQFDQNKLVISQIRSKVGEEFQERIFWLLQEVWSRAKSGVFPKPEATKYRCKRFGEICPASKYCDSYKAMMNPTGDHALDQLLESL